MRKSVWIEKLPGGYSVRYWETDAAGTSHAKREWVQDYAEAQRRKADLKLKLLAKRQGLLDPTIKPVDLVELYLKDVSTTNRESTLEHKRFVLEPFVQTVSSIQHFNYIAIQRYKDHLLSKYSPTTAHIRLSQIRAFTYWCVKNKYLQENPFENVSIPAGKKRTRKLELDEIKRLLSVADPRFKPYLLLLVFTGARKTETMKADWSHFNLKDGTWFIPKENCKTNVEGTIPLNDQVVEALKPLQQPSGPVFPGWMKTTPQWYLKKALRELERLGTPIKGPLSPHVFRHSFASHWRGDPRILMDIMRWKNVAMLKDYSHFNLEQMRKEAREKGIGAQL